MKNNKSSILNLIIILFSFLLIIGVFAYSFNFLKDILEKLELEIFDESGTETQGSDGQESDAPGDSDNSNVSEDMIKIKFNLFKTDFDEENYDYKEKELYKTIPLTVKKGSKFKFALEDLSSEGYYPSSDMIIEGVCYQNQIFDIYYYEFCEEIELFEYNESDKSVSVGFTMSFLDDKCIILRSCVDYDIEKVIFRCDNMSGSYFYVVSDYIIPKNGYLILFPSLAPFGKILGYEKNGNSYNDFMTCKDSDLFDEIKGFGNDIASADVSSDKEIESLVH